MGKAKHGLKKYEEALDFYRQYLAVQRAQRRRVGIGVALNSIAIVQRERGQLAQALESFQQALATKRGNSNGSSQAATLINIGALHEELGRFEQALASYEQARRLLEESPHWLWEAKNHWGRARLLLRDQRAAEAVKESKLGVELMSAAYATLAQSESARAGEQFAGLIDVGCRASVVARQQESLFWFIEHGSAGALREMLGSRLALEAAVIPAEHRRALALARQRVRASVEGYREARLQGERSRTRAARRLWRQAQQDLLAVARRVEREEKAAAAMTLTQPDDLKSAQSRLGEHEALVMFGPTHDGTVATAIVARSDRVRTVAFPGKGAIRNAVAELLQSDQGVDPSKVASAQELLVKPLGLAKEVRRVFVAPTGRLGYVPFALLLPSKEVVNVPSASTYGLLVQDRANRGTRVLAIGDPDYDTISEAAARAHRSGGLGQLAPLPATRAEVAAVGDLKLVGSEATETRLHAAALDQERWRAIHLACHGLIDTERAMLSSLALTADAENDGFLTALEVFRARFPSDLVVLSACETGRGRVYRSEGIVGLARAFMFAGAPRVICSLWRVDDKATKALMVKFYELWNPKFGKRLGAVAALKEAQRFVREHEKWSHPYYWAAWVLWGLGD